MAVNEGEGCKPAVGDFCACVADVPSNDQAELCLLPPIAAIRGMLARELQIADCRIELLNEDKPPEDAPVEKRIDHTRESACRQGARSLIKHTQGRVEVMDRYDRMLPEAGIAPYDSDPKAAFIDTHTILRTAKKVMERKARQLRDGNPGDLAPLPKQFDYVRETAAVRGEAEARKRLVARLHELQSSYSDGENTKN